MVGLAVIESYAESKTSLIPVLKLMTWLVAVVDADGTKTRLFEPISLL